MLKALLLSLMNLASRAIALASALALAVMATAQNLVPNPSFEDTANCDLSTQCTLLKATGWYNPTVSTPDVWDCDLDRLCGMGMADEGGNNLSYQYAHEGTRHAGAFYWFGPGSSNTREYMGIRLNTPLEAGHLYEVSCWCSRARNYRYAVDHIGAWLGLDSLWQNTTWWLAQTPQARLRDPSNAYLVEGDVWVQVADTIVAAGGEEWLVVGNFDVADSVDGIVAEPGAVNHFAYYYLDALGVVDVGEVNGFADQAVQVLWQSGRLIVRWPSATQPSNLAVYDPAGRLVAMALAADPSGGFSLMLDQLTSGLYIVLVSDGHQRGSARFVKE